MFPLHDKVPPPTRTRARSRVLPQGKRRCWRSRPSLYTIKFLRQPTHSLFPTLLRGSELLRLACNSLKIRLPVPFSYKLVAKVSGAFAPGASVVPFITVHRVRISWAYAPMLYGLMRPCFMDLCAHGLRTYAPVFYGVTASGFVRGRFNPSCPPIHSPVLP